MARAMFGNGLATAARPSWLFQRRLLQPAFHRQRVAAFGELMTNTIEDTRDGWEHMHGPGETLDVRAEMSRLTLRIAIRALFASDLKDAAAYRFMDAVDTSNQELLM
ncbi:cytochrome P450 [Nocardia amamiensis]|uniref:Cytochrome P450 n=1 Tax=Nocardia amamiensis TaxID=404578 RepID=A0ABS0D2G7_9NOCA|nr:cytochrome P450 [Nocardia amamiensis]MBF6303038.1 cytochrome P450 [Nocardia amamiensis]